MTDGRPGNVAQALGVAEALARRLPADIERRDVALRRFLDAAPQALLSRLPPRLLLRAFADPAGLAGTADLVVGAGRRGALASSALRRARGVPAVTILDPQMPLARFDAVIAPEHDRLSGTNVVATVGAPNRLTPGLIQAAAEALPPEWRPEGPAVVAMVGGPIRSARFDAAAMARLLEDVARFDNAGWWVLAVTSRRTPDWAAPMLRERFPSAAVWGGEGPNPYPGVLGAARAALVTEDSVNMASEAATAGLPVFVSGLGAVSPKIRRFHESLAARGCSRPASEASAEWTYAPLAEADRVAEILLGGMLRL